MRKTDLLAATFADKARWTLGRVIADRRHRESPFEGWGPRLNVGLDVTIR
ncbi:MAG: hypothetical protein ABI346_02985 [Candidatus Baltobacteraceae bacterium]